MSEKLEKALTELNDLIGQVNEIRKEGEEMAEDEILDLPEEDASTELQSMEYKAADDEDADVDDEKKALDEEGARNEAGETVVEGGTPQASTITLKGFENDDFSIPF